LARTVGSRTDAREAHRAAIAVGVLLLAVYVATMAPTLTFWDAGEFATAIGTFGIPHPPGTPLYVALGTSVYRALPGVAPVVAGGLVSALSTSMACAIAAWIVTRASGQAIAGVLAGLCAGAMGSVWANATETEVYAVSLLSVALQFALAWRAHVRDDDRARIALTYAAALSLPLHLSALVASPAALLLANTAPDSAGIRWRPLIGSSALVLATILVSQGALLAAGACIAIVGVAASFRDPRARWLRPAALTTPLAWSAIFILLVRARHDPFLNQGNPDTWQRLLDVVTRTQYDVAPIWPRRAQFWLQLGNVIQYADWQVALSAWNDVMPSWVRTPFSTVAAMVGIAGVRAHWRTHRATARATIVLFLLATVGIVVQLNLRAGPSYGAGILPETAIHEARERDYFFALAFWVWGLWIGVGALALCRRAVRPARARAATLVACSVPLLMLGGNWSALTRRSMPDSRIASMIGAEFLRNAPRNAMLFTAGDNDSYPLWYQQGVNGLRTDVRVVVTSLLPAEWYRRESERRAGGLVLPSFPTGALARAGGLAGQILDNRGTVAVSLLIPAAGRAELAQYARIECWRRVGLIDVGSRGSVCPPRIDLERTSESASRLAGILAPPARNSPDGMNLAFQTIAACPRAAVHASLFGVSPTDSGSRRLLDITCNLR
jgi:Protein of unknown function (DUF2723)